MKKGFTIIEVVTYLGILSAILTVILPTFYFVSKAIKDNQSLAIRSEEINFISAKINNLISSATSIQEPFVDEGGKILKIIIDGSVHSVIEITESADSIFIKRNRGVPEKINSGRVLISDLVFFRNSANSFFPNSISYSFKVDSYSVPTTTIEISHYD